MTDLQMLENSFYEFGLISTYQRFSAEFGAKYIPLLPSETPSFIVTKYLPPQFCPQGRSAPGVAQYVPQNQLQQGRSLSLIQQQSCPCVLSGSKTPNIC